MSLLFVVFYEKFQCDSGVLVDFQSIYLPQVYHKNHKKLILIIISTVYFFRDCQYPFIWMKLFKIIFLTSQFSQYRKKRDNFIIHSIIHQMYLQRVQKSTLSPFDDNRFYENKFESKPWG